MESLYYLFSSVMLIFDYDFTIWGFTFSFFDVFIASILIGLIGNALYKIFGGD